MPSGGARPPKRKDDKRLICKVKNPVRVTILVNQNDLDEMRRRYKRGWLDVLRQLIKGHLSS